MCSFGTRDLESLTSHICRLHKSDPRFLIYCSMCLRSYTKWDSYRKHIQRGCSVIHQEPEDTRGNDFPHENEEIGDPCLNEQPEYEAQLVSQEWLEAKYILNIKEKYILSQVAIDHVLASTKLLVSDILDGIIRDVCGSIPFDTVEVFKEKAGTVNRSLFENLSTAFLQRKYFKEHFNLVVSKHLIIKLL